MQRRQRQCPQKRQRHDEDEDVGDNVHDSVADPVPESLLACPDGLSGIPVPGKRKTDSRPRDDAGNCPHSEEGQEDVAEALKRWERKDAPVLKDEGGLEEHDGDVVTQR